MNFSTESPWNIPELHWHYGYPVFWGIAVLIGAGMLIFFRRKKWL
jgi:magnesium transporter